jgi:hypothetical protein
MTERTFIVMDNDKGKALPPQFQGQDCRLPEVFLEYVLNTFTSEGDRVLDVFAGYGTTLLVSERMKREAYGIEYTQERHKFAQSLLAKPERLIRGDALLLSDIAIPVVDLCIVSPPYLSRFSKSGVNPIRGFAKQPDAYNSYLDDIGLIMRQVDSFLAPAGHIVIEVSNLKDADGVCTLAWDIQHIASRFFHFEGETIVGWNGGYGYGYDHSYMLVFSKQRKEDKDNKSPESSV